MRAPCFPINSFNACGSFAILGMAVTVGGLAGVGSTVVALAADGWITDATTNEVIAREVKILDNLDFFIIGDES